MAEFIARLTEQIKSLSPEKRRLTVICVAGVVLTAFILRPESAEQVTASTLPPKQVKVKEGSMSVQPAQKEVLPVPTAARDPFAVPSGFEAKPENPPKSLQNEVKSSAVAVADTASGKPGKDVIAKEEVPILIGTINDNETGIAIISHKGCSRSYHIGQMIGSYKLLSINDKSVIIQGLQGQQALTLGR